MKVNPLPFLFLPGVVLFGYVANGGAGTLWALAIWTIPVVAGTLLNVVREHAERSRRERNGWSESLSPSRPEGISSLL